MVYVLPTSKPYGNVNVSMLSFMVRVTGLYTPSSLLTTIPLNAVLVLIASLKVIVMILFKGILMTPLAGFTLETVAACCIVVNVELYDICRLFPVKSFTDSMGM